MKNEGNNLYSYTIPADLGNARVIVSDNGNNQVPGEDQQGIQVLSGSIVIYNNGVVTN